MTTRRNFLKKAMMGTALVSVGGVLPGFSAKSYARIVGANDRIRVGAAGVNARGFALANNFCKQKNCEVIYVCDVDKRAIEKSIASIEKITGNAPKPEGDIRKMIEAQDVDAIMIATPDHWHAYAALMAMKAGKDVYLEKPCSYCPEEGEILVKAADKYKRVVAMGTQRRSWPNVIQGINEIKEGAIGNPYFGKAWYTNNRPSIGIEKVTAVPEWLDWDLWQGPAPRVGYKPNFLHYNWHWFWHWGTSESANNGTHMIDLLRWGMGVDYPTKVNSYGGRYRYQDDWETPDTQVINLEFGNNKSMVWEGRSCNGRTIEGSTVGAMFYGEKGSMVITGSDGYIIYDLDNKKVKQVYSKIDIDARNLVDPAKELDGFHIRNFLDGILKGEKLNADILTGHKSTLLMQLGNISHRVGHSLEIDSSNGQILNAPDTKNLWTREYQKGWEVKL